MNLLISNLKELMNKTGYSIKNMYQNPDLNYFFACFDFVVKRRMYLTNWQQRRQIVLKNKIEYLIVQRKILFLHCQKPHLRPISLLSS